MLTSTEPFLSAEIAYRQGRTPASPALFGTRRHCWLRRPTSSAGRVRQLGHRLFPAH
jgi:hypothetical protein